MNDSPNLFSTTVDGVWIVPVFHERLEAARLEGADDVQDFERCAVHRWHSLRRTWAGAVIPIGGCLTGFTPLLQLHAEPASAEDQGACW